MRLPDYWLKYHRAKKHLTDVDAYLDDWFTTAGNFSARIGHASHDPDRLEIRATAQALPVDPLSLILADVVQNFRCSLDQQVFALASRHALPGDLDPKVASESQFPIVGFLNRRGELITEPARSFREQLDRISGLPSGARDAIEAAQPFQKGSANYASDPIWYLATLSNLDKHRALHVATGLYTEQFVLDPVGRKGPRATRLQFADASPMTFSASGSRVGDDTLVAWIDTMPRVQSQRELRTIEVVPSIALLDGPLAHADVRKTLRDIEIAVSVLLTGLDKFF